MFGAEAYWVKDRFEKDRSNCHIYVGAKNENGRRAINDALSEANITGFYGQARLDIPLILGLPKNDVIITSACVAGWRYDDADAIWEEIAKHFGKNFFFEVQYHNTPSQIELNKRILALRDKLNVPIIMGCDSHYIYENQAQERVDFLYSKGLEYPEEVGWFLDYPDGQTAYNRFVVQDVLTDAQIREAMDNTNIFLDVEEYDSPIFNSEIKMPTLYPNWTQEQRDEEYKRLVWAGWENYKKDIPAERYPEYEEEIRKEMDIVTQTKMSDYFILNHHIIKQGVANGGNITKSGRGSAPSFFTNTLMGFSDIDRVSASVKMYPERFMSIERILQAGTLPDVDFNLAPVEPFARAQQQVLGEDHAYPMIAYGTMKSSAAWKLYAKSQDVEFSIANEVSNQLKKYEFAVKHADEDAKDDISPLDYIDPQYHEIFERSKEYRGLISSWSIAPCSYLLYNGSIRKEVGLIKIKDHLCCLMDGHWAEEGHFLKNDLLKVAVVDLIYQTYRRIGREPPKVKELLEMCPPNDPVWDIYGKSCTLGINQVEQKGTSARAAVYKPKNISELAAFVAAIRPGFKSMYKTFESREPFAYGCKAFDGLMQSKEMPNSFVLYQEQEMAALNYAGISMADAYTAIKNIAKKRADKVLAYKDVFKGGFKKAMIEQDGKTEEEAEAITDRLWKIIEDSASYSFNCVSGDTILERGRGRNSYKPTVHEMYQLMHDISYSKETGHYHLSQKYRRSGYGKAFSMCEDSRIRENNIVDIRPSGSQEVFLVTTKTGKTVKCTASHKFPTPLGEKELKELTVGSEVYCVGEYEKCKTNYTFTEGKWKPNYPSKGQCGFRTREDGDSVLYHKFRKEKIESESRCEDCGTEYSDDKRFEVHHTDFDRTNNSFDNYSWLCVSCHKKRHYANGRRKKYEKGIPTYVDEIESIVSQGFEDTYDIEMDGPNHNFVVKGGLVVSNCSHAYCVALDSLYSAWVKAHYPLEFYETLLKIAYEKGDKNRMAEVKEEAENYFNIKFPPFRFGQDNRNIVADRETNSIINTISSVKGFGITVGRVLYECSKHNFRTFMEVIQWLYDHKIFAAKIEPLIKIDYFQQFGTAPTLLKILGAYEFFKEGDAKTVRKDKVAGTWYDLLLQEYATDRNAKGMELKSYTITDMKGLLLACEKYIRESNLPDFDYRMKMSNQLELLGYIDLTTGKEEDRRKLVLTDVFPMKSKTNSEVWGYAIKTKSIGSGKVGRMTIKTALFNRKPVKQGDIIEVPQNGLWKNQAGYWYLQEYTVIA